MSSGLIVSLPEALSVKTRFRTWPSSWRFSFLSSMLTARTQSVARPQASATSSVGLSTGPSEKKIKTYGLIRQVGVCPNPYDLRAS